MTRKEKIESLKIEIAGLDEMMDNIVKDLDNDSSQFICADLMDAQDRRYMLYKELIKLEEEAAASDQADSLFDEIKSAIVAGKIKIVVATTPEDYDGPDGYSLTEGSVQELLDAAEYWYPLAYEVRFGNESVRFTIR